MKRIIYILILAALAACTKEDGPSSRLMEFSLSMPGAVSTKVEVTESGLNSENIFVYATKSDGKNTSLVFDAGVNKLTYNSDNGVWNAKKDESSFYEWDTNENYYYRFYSYAYSSNAVTAWENDRNLVIDNTTYGRQFTVTQPETGDGTGTIDYLLSYIVNVPQGTYPLVPLRLEHAMAKVEVDVQIAQSMFDVNGCLVSNVSVSVSGIRSKATMLCVQPKFDGEEGTNTWQVTWGDGNAAYTKSGIDITVSNRVGTNSVAPDMSFIAIPVTNAEMAGADNYKLTLSYHGVKSGNNYEYTFPLKDFSPKGWVNGHKVRYVLTIDNSVHLTGSIVDYEDVDYIEAVIVPGQGTGVQN